MKKRKAKAVRSRRPKRRAPSIAKAARQTSLESFPFLGSRTFDENFHLVAEALPEIVWTGEPDGTIDYMNRRWFAYTGLSEKETYSESKTAVHPDDYAQYRRKWKQAVRSKKPYEVEYRFRRAKDGMYRWFLGRGLPLKNKRGHVIKWFGTCTDIHDQKMAEAQVRMLNAGLESKVQERTQELRQAREKDRGNLQRMHSIIANLAIGVIATDENDVILAANDLFCKYLLPKRKAKNIIGKPGRQFQKELVDTIEEDTSPRTREAEKSIAKRKAVYGIEVRQKNGRILLLDYIPVFKGGTYHGQIVMYRDITGEKRVDAAKSEFMSLASHQLRTPLTSVRWALGRLSKTLADTITDNEKMLLSRARDYSATMAETISTMLSISRVEAGVVSPQNRSIDIGVFLQQVSTHFTDVCAARNLTVRIHAPRKLTMHSDENLLREIMENIVSNAIKYTPVGGSIELSAQMKGKKLKLSVSDTGYGIPSEQQEKIFGKFFRGQNITHIDTEGTGLGLYLVSRLAELIGAKIDLESEVGKGSTFTLTFTK